MTQNIKGLTSQEVIKSLKLHGDNSLVKEKRKGFFGRFFENLSDPIIKILLLALGIQIALTFRNINFVEVFGILCAILISTTVSTISEFRSEKAFDRLESDGLDREVRVLRDGRIQNVSSYELVVGDIVYLYAGEKIQADGTIISGKLSVDQSALNGESAEITKIAGEESGWDLGSRHRVFRGSVILDGTAIMRVGRVGGATYYGMVAKDIQSETRESPLKLRLGKLAAQISKIGYVIAAIVGVAYLFGAIVVDNGFSAERIVAYFSNVRGVLETLIHTLTLMITVVVVAAPEGLPMMITVVLSANMKKMLSDNILVKKLVGIETAGSMNVLFTDKTGTITEGRPICDRIITKDGVYRSISTLKRSGAVFEYLCVSAKYNTDVLESGGEITGGNATDRAIYSFFMSAAPDKEEVISKIPFSSEKKYSSVTLKNGKTLIKGGAELILSSCKSVIDGYGRKVAIDKEYFYKEYALSASQGERVIAIAVSESKEPSDCSLIALISMKDRIRAGVSDAVRDVKRAGVQIVMITGDGIDTAVAIASECGIMNQKVGHIALSGDMLHKMTDEEIRAVFPNVRVISRALPQDKTRLVRLAQELDLVVGMTGDGINDAPSLKLSDVGFAMGSGTDIAKSAADVVIVDNSFSAISKTLLYGRSIFKSIRKFITFQLIMNFAACGISLIGQFIGVDTPITIIQMLWINIIMDTLGGLAFAGEPALKYYMNEKPKRRDEPILTSSMLAQIFLCGAFTLLLCIVFLTSPTVRRIYSGELEFFTAFYALFIFAGIFNCFAARCERMWILSNITKNKYFVLIMIAISIIQICMIYFGGDVFRCTPLSFGELSFAVMLAFSVIPFDIIRRVLVRLK